MARAVQTSPQPAVILVAALCLAITGCVGSSSPSTPSIPQPPSASLPSLPSGSPSSSSSSKPSSKPSSSSSSGKSSSDSSDSSSSSSPGASGPSLPSPGSPIPGQPAPGTPGSTGSTGDVADSGKKTGTDAGAGEFPGAEFPNDKAATKSGDPDGDLKGKGTAQGEEETADSSGNGGDMAVADGQGDGSGTPGGTQEGDFSSDEDLTLEDAPLLEDALEDSDEALLDAGIEGEGRDGDGVDVYVEPNMPGVNLPLPAVGLPLPTGGVGTSTGDQGPKTSAEQVAILDAELERSAGDFDGMILDEQNRQREQTARSSNLPQSQSNTESDSGQQADGAEVPNGNYSVGGGMPGKSRPGDIARNNIPQSTAKFPPPADIPSGNDDDVVARQLREAAMREPDPELREKLWDEYRKYKGISQ